MKSYLVIFFLVYSLGVSGQEAKLTLDSSALVLVPGVQLGSAKKGTRGTFLTRSEMRTLVTHVNFLSNMLSASNRKVDLLERNDSLQQGTIALLESKHQIERQRAEHFRSGMQLLESVTATYDARLKACADDLALASKQTKKVKRRSFIKGVALGAGIGLVALTATVWRD